jgi:hypothetical protein
MVLYNLRILFSSQASPAWLSQARLTNKSTQLIINASTTF